MTKELIIIDDVDVAECEHRCDTHKELLADGHIKEFVHYCQITNTGCYGYNCYYKQLKRKEQEYEELKEKYLNLKEQNGSFIVQLNNVNEKLNQLKEDNDELKKDYAIAKGMYDLCQSDFMELAKIKDNYKQALQDIKKITVTLKADICSYCDSKDTDRCEQTDIDELEQILQKCEVVDD